MSSEGDNQPNTQRRILDREQTYWCDTQLRPMQQTVLVLGTLPTWDFKIFHIIYNSVAYYQQKMLPVIIPHSIAASRSSTHISVYQVCRVPVCSLSWPRHGISRAATIQLQVSSESECGAVKFRMLPTGTCVSLYTFDVVFDQINQQVKLWNFNCESSCNVRI